MKQNILKHLFISFLLLIGVLILPQSTNAQSQSQTIKVSPVIENINLDPGKVYEYKVTVENLSNIPLPVKTSINDFDTEDETGDFILKNSKDNPMIQWMKLSEKDMIINAKSKKEITVEITIPKKVSLGGYYTVLFFQPIISPIQGSSVISPKVGVLFLANIGIQDPKAKKAEILDYSLQGILHETTPINTSFKVKNISLNHFTAKPILTLKPLVGTNERIFIEEKVVFPGKSRLWEYSLNPKSGIGIYNADLIISTGNGQQVSSNKWIVIFPVAKTLLIITILLIILVLIRKRRNIKKAFKAFKNTPSGS